MSSLSRRLWEGISRLRCNCCCCCKRSLERQENDLVEHQEKNNDEEYNQQTDHSPEEKANEDGNFIEERGENAKKLTKKNLRTKKVLHTTTGHRQKEIEALEETNTRLRTNICDVVDDLQTSNLSQQDETNGNYWPDD